MWGVFLLMPVLLTPYWIRINELGLFSWFKFYTVFFCVCWGTALRFTWLGRRPWARATIALLLAANIAEAVTVDLVGHGAAHIVNAAAGLLLIATMPYGKQTTRIDSAGRYRDLRYTMSRRWVIGYTLWNWTFVYLNYPALAGHHAAVLAAGLIVAMVHPRRWAQTRASTLGVSLLLTATCYREMVAWMDTSTWFSEPVATLAALLTLAYMGGYAARFWRPRVARTSFRGRRPPAPPRHAATTIPMIALPILTPRGRLKQWAKNSRRVGGVLGSAGLC